MLVGKVQKKVGQIQEGVREVDAGRPGRRHTPTNSTVPSCRALPSGRCSRGACSRLSRPRRPPNSRAFRRPPAANGASGADAPAIRDLTGLLWASIDNDDSRDLDQLTVAETLPGDAVKIRVAVADVDALVKDGSAIDAHARHNTTSVYTAAKIFPMLPEKLSTDLTSLNLDEDRLAVVVEMVVGADGSVQSSDIYRARVRNHAKLAYNSVAAWLEGSAAMPAGDCGRQWTGGEPARAGPDRPAPEEPAARPRGAESGNHPGEAGL